MESIHHVLLHCEFASRVWNFWADGLHLIQRNSWIFSDLALFILSHKSLQDLELFFTVAWAIWYNRNKSIYEGTCSPPMQVWQMASCSIDDFSAAATLDLATPRPATSSCWSPPPHGVYKINVDGASSILDGSSSIGVIIRDCKGDTIATLCKPLQSHFSAELVEVLALEHGVLLAQDMQLTRVMFECDASNVINAVNDSAIGTPFGHIIQDIIQAQASFSFCSFRHLNRAFNYATHELASFARRNGSFQLWKGVTPPFLVSIVNADLLLYFSCFAGSSHV